MGLGAKASAASAAGGQVCQRWLNADELIGPRHLVEADAIECGKLAVADVLEHHHDDWTACEEHAAEVEREGARVERWGGICVEGADVHIMDEAGEVSVFAARCADYVQRSWGECKTR